MKPVPIATRIVLAGVIAMSASMLGGAQSALAFCAGPGGRWVAGFDQTLKSRPNLPDNWHQAISAARFAWVNIEPALHYGIPQFNTNAIGDFELHLVDFSDQGLGTGPARTFNSPATPPHQRSIVYLNSEWTFTLDGTFNVALKKADLRTVLTHEFGHASGLEHPDWCDGVADPFERGGVMYLTYTKKWSLGGDDKNGIKALY